MEGTGESDSLAEETGFEPLVPRENGWLVLTTLIDLKALLAPRKSSDILARGTERCYGAGGEEWQLRRCI